VRGRALSPRALPLAPAPGRLGRHRLWVPPPGRSVSPNQETMGQTKTAPARKPKPDLPVSRKRAYGGLLRLLAVGAWMFFVGVLVGRGTAPIRFDMAQLERELRALKDAAQSRQVEALESYAAAVESTAERDVYETLKRADERLSIDPELARRVDAPEAEESESLSPESAAGTETRVVRRQSGLQPKARPRAASAATAPPSPRPVAAAPEASGGLTLQGAALQDLQGARELTERLRRQGLEAHLVTATLPGKGVWHRVRVGRFRDRQAAETLLRRLEAQGMQPMVVPR